jgi:hypothetical protein
MGLYYKSILYHKVLYESEARMQDRFAQIQFITANYSKLQGLRAVPVGILAVFVSIWSLYNQGPSADLGVPILVALVTALLYWLTDRYYSHTLGQVKRTARQRRWELVISVCAAILALLAFILDTAEIFPVSAVGLVFSISFLEYFVRSNPSEWGKIFTRFPESVTAALVIAVICLLPLFGIDWWHLLGIRSQLIALFMIVGVVIIVTGIWGHVRLVHALPAGEAK